MQLCFATNNKNKVAEIQRLLSDDIQLLSLSDIGCEEELEETHDTLEGNSQQKAEYVYLKYNVPVFADDTGLEINALNGEPGVLSARYAGPKRDMEANIALVHEKLSPYNDWSAQFRTIITLIYKGVQHQFEGIVSGKIISDRKGTDGFGYDPIFVPDGYEQTFAQMTLEEKNKISHRGRAIKKLAQYLNNNELG